MPPKKNTGRLERVAALIQSEIAEILRRKVNDKRIGFVSITTVEVSSDLAHAWVRYSHIGSKEDFEASRKGLRSAAKFIKGEIGKVLQTQRVPEIHFMYDDRLEKTAQLIDKINALSDQ